MAFDRVVTVTVYGPYTRNEHRETVKGLPVDYEVWATVFDKSLEDKEGEGGTSLQRRRDWKIRYAEPFAITDITRMEVTDGGLLYDVKTIIEDTGRVGQIRHRYLTIQGVYAS